MTFELEKMIDTAIENKPSSVCLSEDGLLCVISFEDGELGIYKVD